RSNGAGRVSIPTGHRLMSAGVLAQLERAGVTSPKE
ncbi:type II toxin-antitoxin system HicA family toxin, partial [Xanthomonas citri pv. citri]|nr:type II toxin-antitoxin system HicA family toxin [Xanthomonas citri pv. citri]